MGTWQKHKNITYQRAKRSALSQQGNMSKFVYPLQCITAFFNGRDFSERQSSRGQLVKMLITLEPHGKFWIKLHTSLFKQCPAIGMQTVTRLLEEFET